MMDEIIVELVNSNTLIRQNCTVCGGQTERVHILAEATELDGKLKVRVCETCLEHGNIDEQLETHAKRLASGAKHLCDMKGRLVLPTFADWQKRNDEIEENWDREYAPHTEIPFDDCPAAVGPEWNGENDFGGDTISQLHKAGVSKPNSNGCPECGDTEGVITLDGQSWGVCNHHHTRWLHTDPNTGRTVEPGWEGRFLLHGYKIVPVPQQERPLRKSAFLILNCPCCNSKIKVVVDLQEEDDGPIPF